ncbi:hypothetical protein B0J13DRAFT_624726 [Dactylonectria estremocensis]|uniref:Uncharacterized protein n=1 Tax=Dactylonectria estremocensis TaxID=1079267 RepID=A0A9P9EMQ2_9HYPO|nr:hypothetical protein B0J13DRAFT_624726 [Dactylonectria estremocensis]
MSRNAHCHKTTLSIHRNGETTRLLAGAQGVEQQPSFSLTFSTMQLLRIPIIPIAIADIILMANCHDYVALGILLECIPVGLCLWTGFNAFGASGASNNNLEITVGDYLLFLGRKSQDIDGISPRKTPPYQIILGDLLASVLLILLTFLSLASQILQYDVRWRVFPLTLTLTILQLALTVFNFFSLFRKAKLTLHMAENDQNIKPVIPEYTDEEPEPEQPCLESGRMRVSPANVGQQHDADKLFVGVSS